MVLNKDNIGGGSGEQATSNNNEVKSTDMNNDASYDVKKESDPQSDQQNKADNMQFEQEDATQIERNNVGIIGNLALSSINHDIEDLQPNVGSIQM